MMRRVAMLVLVLACGRSGSGPHVAVAPETASATITAPAEVPAPKPLTGVSRLPENGYADITTAPVHIWAGRAPDGVVERIVLAGHADLACCQTISSLIGASIMLGTIEGDFYHGFADVRARDTPEGILAMQEILGVIEQSRNSEAECAQQVHVYPFATAEHSNHLDRIRGDADKGFTLASALHRPLLLWNDNFSGPPHFAPVLVPDADGRLGPLQLELALTDIHLPRALQAAPFVLRDEVRAARAVVARIKNISALFAELRDMVTSGIDLAIRQDRINVTGDGVHAAMADIRSYSRCFEHARDIWRRIERANRDFQINDDTASRTLKELGGFMAENERSLRRLGELGNNGSAEFPVMRCETATAAFDPKLRSQILRFNPTSAIAHLEAEAERWQKMAANFNADMLATQVDSGLRGINLSTPDPARERVFDVWMAKHQIGLWQKLRQLATVREVTLGTQDDPAGVLHASNLVLRVEKLGDRVRITPHFVLAGPFYQVIDPLARLVYYESAIAEHHLTIGEE